MTGGRVRKTVSFAVLALLVASLSGSAIAFDGYRLLRLDGRLVKWGKRELGSGATVSYAYITRGRHFPGARNCREMVPLDSLAESSGLMPPALHREIAAAFVLWQAAADISFHPSADPTTAQILIGAQRRPRGTAFADVAYQGGAAHGIRGIARALICLNPKKAWKIGFDGDLDIHDLRYAVAHEIGHAIGLNHPGAEGELMSFRYTERFHGLQAGDVAGATALYGRRVTGPEMRKITHHRDPPAASSERGGADVSARQ